MAINKQTGKKDAENTKTGMNSGGPKGVKKTPGEKDATSTNNEIQKTQKMKKVDGDPSLPSDRTG